MTIHVEHQARAKHTESTDRDAKFVESTTKKSIKRWIYKMPHATAEDKVQDISIKDRLHPTANTDICCRVFDALIWNHHCTLT